MYFKTYYLGCLAHASYLIGGDNGEAAVIDPRRDVEEYIADAIAAGIRIAHVIETHLHADFVSGHLELARRTGAAIHIGHASGAEFAHHPVHEGDTIQMGDVRLDFLETPGHTPEGITITATISGEHSPRFAFTGDTLFVGDVGRPDLAGSKGFSPSEMAQQLFGSLRDKLLTLPDETQVWPAHGAGSSCGRALSQDRFSTIGREKESNPALRLVVAQDLDGFIRYSTEHLAAAPKYFAHDAAKNRAGAASIQEILAAARPLSPGEVESLSEDDTIVLDTRTVADFGLGHVPGAVHIQLEGSFAPWVGNVVPPETDVIVVASPGNEVEAITRLARVGYDRLVGWLDGGMEGWIAAGGETVTVPQIAPSDLLATAASSDSHTILDVRSTDEWESGHIPGSHNIPLPELETRLNEIPDVPIDVLCGSGYRSSIACSLLQRAGHGNVRNIVGGWSAWQETATSLNGHASDRTSV